MADNYNTWAVGTTVRVSAEFTVTGTLTDPDVVELYLRKPDGTILNYYLVSGTVSQEATGKFFRDVFVDASGQWWYEFFGSGTVGADKEHLFKAERSVIP
jgi:hypothetical protein